MIQHISEKEYEEMVRTLKKNPSIILGKLTHKKVDAIHMTFGIAGESGELVDAIKKWVIYDQSPLDRENVIEELGDLEFYLEGIRQTLNITRQECLDQNRFKLGTRYTNMLYTDQQAKERKDKQNDNTTT